MKLEGYRCEACGAETYDKPGEWFEVMSARVSHSKTGDGYWLCSYHAERFKDDVTPACNIIPPETGSDAQQYDGSGGAR